MEREGAAVTCDGRLFHRRAAATGNALSQSYIRDVTCHGITECYLPPDASEPTPLNPSQRGWYSTYLPQRDGRLSWLKWLGTYRDGLPVRRQSPIQVVTAADVEQLRWSCIWHSGCPRSNTPSFCHNCIKYWSIKNYFIVTLNSNVVIKDEW